jgi:hypothetical protein
VGGLAISSEYPEQGDPNLDTCSTHLAAKQLIYLEHHHHETDPRQRRTALYAQP